MKLSWLLLGKTGVTTFKKAHLPSQSMSGPHSPSFPSRPSPQPLGGAGLGVQTPQAVTQSAPQLVACLPQHSCSPGAGMASMRGREGDSQGPRSYSPRRLLLAYPKPFQPGWELQLHVLLQRQALQPQSSQLGGMCEV